MLSRILKANKKSEKVERKRGGRNKEENVRPIKFHTGETKHRNLVLVLILFCYSCPKHKLRFLQPPEAVKILQWKTACTTD